MFIGGLHNGEASVFVGGTPKALGEKATTLLVNRLKIRETPTIFMVFISLGDNKQHRRCASRTMRRGEL